MAQFDVVDLDEERDDPPHAKWYYISEMWGGLGLFLVIVLIIIVSFLNGQRDYNLKKAKINACGHSDNIPACIKAVK